MEDALAGFIEVNAVTDAGQVISGPQCISEQKDNTESPTSASHLGSPENNSSYGYCRIRRLTPWRGLQSTESSPKMDTSPETYGGLNEAETALGGTGISLKT